MCTVVRLVLDRFKTNRKIMVSLLNFQEEWQQYLQELWCNTAALCAIYWFHSSVSLLLCLNREPVMQPRTMLLCSQLETNVTLRWIPLEPHDDRCHKRRLQKNKLLKNKTGTTKCRHTFDMWAITSLWWNALKNESARLGMPSVNTIHASFFFLRVAVSCTSLQTCKLNARRKVNVLIIVSRKLETQFSTFYVMHVSHWHKGMRTFFQL